MSTVQKPRPVRKPAELTWPDDEYTWEPSDPHEWAPWTDEIAVAPIGAEPDETELEQLEQLESLNRFGYTGGSSFEPAVPAIDWLAGEISYHGCLSRQDGDYHDLVVTLFNDLLIVLRNTFPRSPAPLVARRGHRWSGLDLAAVRLPEIRDSAAAEALDDLGNYYLERVPGPLGRLAAAVIFGEADAIESLGAGSLREYYRMLDERVDPTTTYDHPGLAC